MNEMTLPFGHKIRNSSPGGLRPNTYFSVTEAPHNIVWDCPIKVTQQVRDIGSILVYYWLCDFDPAINQLSAVLPSFPILRWWKRSPSDYTMLVILQLLITFTAKYFTPSPRHFLLNHLSHTSSVLSWNIYPTSPLPSLFPPHLPRPIFSPGHQDHILV